MRPLLAAVVCAPLVTGCVTTLVGSQPESRTADPEQLTQWMAKGRIALAAQGEGGSGSFVWQQRSERTGTPAIFTQNGDYIGGYLTPAELVQAIQESQKTAVAAR